MMKMMTMMTMTIMIMRYSTLFFIVISIMTYGCVAPLPNVYHDPENLASLANNYIIAPINNPQALPARVTSSMFGNIPRVTCAQKLPQVTSLDMSSQKVKAFVIECAGDRDATVEGFIKKVRAAVTSNNQLSVKWKAPLNIMNPSSTAKKDELDARVSEIPRAMDVQSPTKTLPWATAMPSPYRAKPSDMIQGMTTRAWLHQYTGIKME
jgi:hypothetical protein